MTWLDNIEQIVATWPFLAFVVVFLAGVLSSASPCVLATLPLMVGFVGGHAAGDRQRAVRYSLAFVLGLSLTFTAFGAAAGLFGTMFGVLGGTWHIVAGLVALVMGGQMLGLYEISLPIKRDYRPRRRGLLGALLLGLFFGVVSSPCATPVLVVLLAVVAGQGQVLYGIALLFTYALGHCLLMLLAGTLTGFVEAFAQSRGLMQTALWARRLGGLIVALAGSWFLWQGLR